MSNLIPDNLQVIDESNVQNLSEIARIGLGSIHQVAYSPDGKYLAAASAIGIWLYDVAFQNPPLLLGKYEYGNGVAFSADSKLIAAPGRNNTIAIWSIETTQQIQLIQCAEEPVDCLAFHPAGTWIATGSWNNVVNLWNTQTGLLDKSLECAKAIRSLSFNHDGSYLAIGCTDALLILWHLPDNQDVVIPSDLGPHGWVQVAFDATDNLAYGSDGTVVIWNLTAQREQRRLKFGGQGLSALSFSPDGRMLATANWAGAQSGPGHIRLWTLDSGEEQIIDSDGGVSVSFRPDGKTLAYADGGWNGTVHLWEIEEKKRYYLPMHGNISMGLAFSHDSKLLAYGANNGFIRVIDIPSGEEKHSVQKPDYDAHVASNTLAFRPNKPVLAFTDWNKLWLWSLDNNEVENLELNEELYFNHSTKTIVFDPNGHNLLIGSPRPFIGDIGQKLLVQILPHTTEDFTQDTAISADGGYIAECGYFKGEDQVSTIRLWQLPDLTLLKSIQTPLWSPQSIAISPDGSKIAAAGRRDAGVKMTAIGALYDVATGHEQLSFTSQTYYGSFMEQTAFNSGGDMVAFADASGSIFFWSTHLNTQLKRLQAHNARVWSMAFSPDGRLLVTIGSDSTVRFWGVV